MKLPDAKDGDQLLLAMDFIHDAIHMATSTEEDGDVADLETCLRELLEQCDGDPIAAIRVIIGASASLIMSYENSTGLYHAVIFDGIGSLITNYMNGLN